MNVVHNWEGIKQGNFFASVGKGIYSYFTGNYEGIINLSNAAWNYTPMGQFDRLTGGYIQNYYGKAATWLEVTSHNIAFDKPVFDFSSPEWTEGRREHKYYSQGSLSTYIVGMGIDLQRCVQTDKERTRYQDIQTKRLKAIKGGWKADFYGDELTLTEPYEDNGFKYFGGLFTSQAGHKLLGAFLPTEDFYYGFELYGEPTERWSKTDLYDDTKFWRWVLGKSDPQFEPPSWFYY